MGFRNTVRGIRPGTVRSEDIEEELTGKVITGGLFRTVAPDLARVEIGKHPDDPSTGKTDEIRWYGADGQINETGSIQATGFNQMLYFADEHQFSSRGGTEEPYPTGRIWAKEGARIDDRLELTGPMDAAGQMDLNGLVSMYAGLALERSPGATACTVLQWDAGVHTDVTDANSRITIVHGLDQIPDVLLVGNWVGSGGTRGQTHVFSRGTLNFQVECLTAAGALTGAGVPRNTYWLALDLA